MLAYAIYYSDGSYLIYELTEKDYQAVEKGLIQGIAYVRISLGILGLEDVRSVIEQRPKPVEELKASEPLSDADTLLWRQMQEEAEAELARRGLDADTE